MEFHWSCLVSPIAKGSGIDHEAGCHLLLAQASREAIRRDPFAKHVSGSIIRIIGKKGDHSGDEM
jgi:hypothetical protein